MYKRLLSIRQVYGERGYLLQKRHWLRTIISLVAILTSLVLISGCGSDNQAADVIPTPARVGDIPTATPGITPSATVALTPAATSASLPMPTPVPVPTRATTAQQPSIPVPTKAGAAQPTTATGSTDRDIVTVWIQVTDSCKQALPGGTFTVTGPGVNMTTAPTSGAGHLTIPNTEGVCPIQQGNCSTFFVGCTSVNLHVPSSGTAIYKITIARTAPGFGTNLSFAVCEGGSACPHGPEVATVRIASSGSVSATTLNYYPDGVSVTWPTNKSAYSAASSDPIMFHEFGIGDGSIQCDGDHDADDYLTGTPGQHCDSDGDKN